MAKIILTRFIAKTTFDRVLPPIFSGRISVWGDEWRFIRSLNIKRSFADNKEIEKW